MLTINVGPTVVTSPEFADALHDVPARRVLVELTEHIAVDDYPPLIAAARDLRRQGIRFAVDDTGSGYSSLPTSSSSPQTSSSSTVTSSPESTSTPCAERPPRRS